MEVTLKETGLQNKELPGDRAPGNSKHNEPKGCTVCIPKLKVSVRDLPVSGATGLKIKGGYWCAVVLKFV